MTGFGEGQVLGFQRAPIGPSAHVIKFEGVEGQKYVKLKRKDNDEMDWLYLPRSGTGSGGVSREWVRAVSKKKRSGGLVQAAAPVAAQGKGVVVQGLKHVQSLRPGQPGGRAGGAAGSRRGKRGGTAETDHAENPLAIAAPTPAAPPRPPTRPGAGGGGGATFERDGAVAEEEEVDLESGGGGRGRRDPASSRSSPPPLAGCGGLAAAAGGQQQHSEESEESSEEGGLGGSSCVSSVVSRLPGGLAERARALRATPEQLRARVAAAGGGAKPRVAQLAGCARDLPCYWAQTAVGVPPPLGYADAQGPEAVAGEGLEALHCRLREVHTGILVAEPLQLWGSSGGGGGGGGGGAAAPFSGQPWVWVYHYTSRARLHAQRGRLQARRREHTARAAERARVRGRRLAATAATATTGGGTSRRGLSPRSSWGGVPAAESINIPHRRARGCRWPRPPPPACSSSSSSSEGVGECAAAVRRACTSGTR
eukprot:COSAG01_NODE_8275_length_2846_cov_3.614993_2_plen_481_part_00